MHIMPVQMTICVLVSSVSLLRDARGRPDEDIMEDKCPITRWDKALHYRMPCMFLSLLFYFQLFHTHAVIYDLSAYLLNIWYVQIN